MRNSRTAMLVAMFGVMALLPACDESDASSVTIEFKTPDSGTVVVRSLHGGDATSRRIEGGVEWQGAAKIDVSHGTFASMKKGVTVKDIRFVLSETPTGSRLLEIVIPRGRDALWPQALAPSTPAEVAEVKATMDPGEKTKDLGKHVKLVVVVPTMPATQSVDTGSEFATVTVKKVKKERYLITILLEVVPLVTDGDLKDVKVLIDLG